MHPVLLACAASTFGKGWAGYVKQAFQLVLISLQCGRRVSQPSQNNALVPREAPLHVSTARTRVRMVTISVSRCLYLPSPLVT